MKLFDNFFWKVPKNDMSRAENSGTVVLGGRTKDVCDSALLL